MVNHMIRQKGRFYHVPFLFVFQWIKKNNSTTNKWLFMNYLRIIHLPLVFTMTMEAATSWNSLPILCRFGLDWQRLEQICCWETFVVKDWIEYCHHSDSMFVLNVHLRWPVGSKFKGELNFQQFSEFRTRCRLVFYNLALTLWDFLHICTCKWIKFAS